MIPKVIHYCWFGRNSKSELAMKCIESWRNYCPDYEIIEWNESNFDINCCDYVREAYEAKKWAFVTDYVRLFILYKYGGVYMDTDVEVVGKLDNFLKVEAFSGFENENCIPTGIIGAVKGNKWIELNLQYYVNKHFKISSSQYDLTTNVITISQITKDNYDIKLDNTLQNLGDVVLYPRDYFCPKDYLTRKILYRSCNTVTIHHFNGSWKSEAERNLVEESAEVRNKFGGFIASLYFNVCQFKILYEDDGIVAVLKLLVDKLRRKFINNIK